MRRRENNTPKKLTTQFNAPTKSSPGENCQFTKDILPSKLSIPYPGRRFIFGDPITVNHRNNVNHYGNNTAFINNGLKDINSNSLGPKPRDLYINGNGQNSFDAIRSSSMTQEGPTFRTTRPNFTKLPLLISVPSSQREALLRAKLQQCCVIFTFDDYFDCADEKEAKRITLNEIITYLTENPKQITPNLYGDLFELLKTNCFRAVKPHVNILPDDEEEPNWEPAWPHIHLVYQLLLKVLESSEFQPMEAKKYTDTTFIVNLLELFDADDPRERDCLKTLLHRIYGQIISTRSAIRKAMMHLFMKFIYETGRHNGIAELLEILGSIINGFQVPLKSEHVVFLEKVLLPLHKPASLPQYHPQLSYCVLEYVRKDVTLFRTVIQKGILKFWPKTLCTKEVMFLNELEELIDIADEHNLNPLTKVIFSHLAHCVNSPHFQVAERTLFYWSNVRFLAFVKNNFPTALSIIFPFLYKSREHWNKNIQTLAFNALKVMMDMDQAYFNKFTEGYREKRRKEKESLRERQRNWNIITEKAYKNPLSGSILASLPEKSNLPTKLPRQTKRQSKHSATSTGSMDLPSIKNESVGGSTLTSSSHKVKKSTYSSRSKSSPKRSNK